MRQAITCIEILLHFEEFIGDEKVPYPEEMVSVRNRSLISVTELHYCCITCRKSTAQCDKQVDVGLTEQLQCRSYEIRISFNSYLYIK